MRVSRLLLLAALCLVATGVSAEPEFQWVRIFDGGGSYTDEALHSLVDESGDVFVAGRSDNGHTGLSLFIGRQETIYGDFVWTRRVPSGDLSEMTVSGMAFDSAGDLVISAYVIGCVG
ncbi:MAG: hypothetical protein GY835_00770 [bacterium]|nr:hypothetical protein [bacterium]